MEEQRKKTSRKTVLSLHSVNVISYLLLYESGEIAESHFTQRRLLFLQAFLKNERFKLHLKKAVIFIFERLLTF